jgi:hypothetical protein
MDTPIPIDRVNSADPAPQRDAMHQLVMVRGDERNPVNLRSAPTINSLRVTTLPYRTVLAVLGRNERGTWLRVQNATFSGWISTMVIFPPGNINSLPIVE